MIAAGGEFPVLYSLFNEIYSLIVITLIAHSVVSYNNEIISQFNFGNYCIKTNFLQYCWIVFKTLFFFVFFLFYCLETTVASHHYIVHYHIPTIYLFPIKNVSTYLHVVHTHECLDASKVIEMFCTVIYNHILWL